MWRYIPGVKRPVRPPVALSRFRNKISKVDEDSCSGSSSENEEIEQRHFCSKWKDLFVWIEYDEQKNIMGCSVCKKYKKTNAFAVSGSKNFRRSALSDHAKSKDHLEAMRTEQEATRTSATFLSAIESADKAMLTLLYTAYFIAKEDIAIMKFEKLTNLLQKCECPNLPRSLYRNRDGCHELIHVMSSYLEEELIQLMHNSPFIGLMIDESTDLSVRKNLVLYVNVLERGVVGTYFAKLIELKQCDAQAIFNSIVEYLENSSIDIQRVSGLGSDGASVMVGQHTGVGARLKQLNPFMLSMHCVAHRLALASENAASSVSYCDEHHSVLKGLYNYFHTSPNHYSVLKEMIEIFDDPVVHIQQVHTIRWLTMHRAVEAVRKCYCSLLATLSNLAVSDPTAKGLYKYIRNYKFIVFTHFLCDILGDLSFLSRFFQHDHIDFSQVQSVVEGTIANIQDTYLSGEVRGEHLMEIMEKVKNPLIFEDHEIIVKPSDEHKCFESMRQFAEMIVANLVERFPSLPIWSSFKVFDPSSYPTTVSSMRRFGQVDVDILIEHFGTLKVSNEGDCNPIIDRSAFLREWPIFKRSVFDNYRGLTFKELAFEIIVNRVRSFPVIAKLLQFILVLPTSSVACERGFSTHNRIRTRFRQQINEKTINSLMQISANGPDDPHHFNFSKALHQWKASRRRQIYSSVQDKVL